MTIVLKEGNLADKSDDRVGHLNGSVDYTEHGLPRVENAECAENVECGKCGVCVFFERECFIIS